MNNTLQPELPFRETITKNYVTAREITKMLDNQISEKWVERNRKKGVFWYLQISPKKILYLRAEVEKYFKDSLKKDNPEYEE